VASIQQGDRAGICITSLDPKLLERGIAASPGIIALWKVAIALVQKVKYYPGLLPCRSKFHVSVDHSTVMVTVSCWGARELRRHFEAQSLSVQEPAITANTDGVAPLLLSRSANKKDGSSLQSSSLGCGADLVGLPQIPFDFS
jgi:hypothetical protein